MRRSPLTRPARSRAGAILLLLIFFAQGVMAIPRLSLTADEPAFLGPGYAYLRTGDLRLIPAAAHPPLLFVLTALPLLLQPGPDVTALPGWAEADLARFAPAFVSGLGQGLEAATFAARLPILLLALLGAALVFRWAAERFGRRAGLFALALFAFDPNLLAHATLATTDLGLAVFGFAGAYLVFRHLQRPSGSALLAAGLALGLTLSAKSSGFFALLVLVPLHALLGARRRGIGRALGEAVVLVGLALLVLWGLYRFEWRPLERPGAPPWPLPFATQWETWLGVQRHARQGHTAFLMGEIRATGWWYYYPLAFLLKTPLPLLLLLLGAVVVFLGAGPSRWREELPLWAYPVAYGLVTLFSTIAIGYRFLLVLLPFLDVFVARLAADRRPRTADHLTTRPDDHPTTRPDDHPTTRPDDHPTTRPSDKGQGARGKQGAGAKRPPDRATTRPDDQATTRPSDQATTRPPTSRLTPHAPRITFLVLLAWYLFGTLRIAPHYLAFFNELAGGPAGGYCYLVDSNLDWGQSFKALRAYLDETGEGPVRLSYYTYADPALYGIAYEPIPPAPGGPPVLPRRFNPAPGTYVLGATTLQGVMVAEPDTYDWFRHREPVARPGYALFVYRVLPPEPAPTWLAQCTAPVAPLPPPAAAEGFGRDDLRMAYFDCTQGWLYPTGGEEPGWYALYRETARMEDAFIEARLADARLSYEQRRPTQLPPFAVYEQPAGPVPPPRSRPEASVRVGDLAFLGYGGVDARSIAPGQTVEVTTWWRVEGLPDRPLSVMLHLVGPGGAPVLVGDGLGVPVEQWRVGDILVQRHRLALPADAPPGEYRLTTGVYWLATLERWPVQVDGEPAGDQVTLPSVVVAGR